MSSINVTGRLLARFSAPMHKWALKPFGLHSGAIQAGHAEFAPSIARC